MHAEVLPVPTAPRIAMPVYNPRCGMVSQSGVGARPGVVAKCDSPSTSDGAIRISGIGYAGNGRVRTLGAYRYATMARTDSTIEAARKGVENHSVAYPYVRTWKTGGFRAAINARKRLSDCTGYACSPHVPPHIATTIATSPRASTTVRNMVAMPPSLADEWRLRRQLRGGGRRCDAPTPRSVTIPFQASGRM